MSEKLHNQSQEHIKSHEAHSSDHEKKHLKDLHEKATNAHEISQDSIDAIKDSIDRTALKSEDYQLTEKETKQPHSVTITKHIKHDAYKKVLRKTQKQLSTTDRAFSKIIHRPAIEKASDIGSKTVARPSGILFGGVGAFIGSLVVFIISKRSGFTYNYILFVLIFICGYMMGLLIELVYRLLTIKNNN